MPYELSNGKWFICWSRVDLIDLLSLRDVGCFFRHFQPISWKFLRLWCVHIRGKNNKVMSCLNPEALRSTTDISRLIKEKVIFFQKTTDLLHYTRMFSTNKSVFYTFGICEAVETSCVETLWFSNCFTPLKCEGATS
jgi:hypothetical protein